MGQFLEAMDELHRAVGDIDRRYWLKRGLWSVIQFGLTLCPIYPNWYSWAHTEAEAEAQANADIPSDWANVLAWADQAQAWAEGAGE